MTVTIDQVETQVEADNKKPDYDTLLKKIEEKVWRLWLEDLRRENERRSGYRS